MDYRQWTIELERVAWTPLWQWRLFSPYGVWAGAGARLFRSRALRRAQTYADHLIEAHYPDETYPPPTSPRPKPGQPPMPFLARSRRPVATRPADASPRPTGP